ncbi:hypothetical protein GOP47_0030273 [Adiantum capillus-veneris]|nr:hypothetical protein GOP47_0030273 [Adiantum capillus-veneris]
MLRMQTSPSPAVTSRAVVDNVAMATPIFNNRVNFKGKKRTMHAKQPLMDMDTRICSHRHEYNYVTQDKMSNASHEQPCNELLQALEKNFMTQSGLFAGYQHQVEWSVTIGQLHKCEAYMENGHKHHVWLIAKGTKLNIKEACALVKERFEIGVSMESLIPKEAHQREPHANNNEDQNYPYRPRVLKVAYAQTMQH